MTVTPAHLDGFLAQNLITTAFANSLGHANNYTTVTNAAIETSVVRNGVACLKCSPTGSAAGQLRKTLAAGHRVAVHSFYVRIASSLPTTGQTLTLFSTTGGTSILVRFNGTSQRFDIAVSGGTAVAIGPTVAADTWYLIDMKLDISAATFTMTARVNGDASTEGTATRASQTPADLTQFGVGTSGTSGPAATIYISDWVYGWDLTEYPYGGHRVALLKPTGDGTHNAGTNIIEDQAGADIGAVTAFNLIDEIPPENTDYIRQFASGSGNYAEVTFDDAAFSTIWGVCSWVAFEAGTGSGSSGMIARTIDASANTLLDQGHAASSLSGTSQRQDVDLVPVPGGGSTWAASDLNGVKGRAGFSTDVVPQPHLLAWQLQYVGLELVTGAATITGSGTLSATGIIPQLGAATITGTGALSVSGTVTRAGAATLVGTSDLDVDGVVSVAGAVVLLAVGSVLVDGFANRFAAALLFGQSQFEARAGESGEAALDGLGDLVVSDSVTELNVWKTWHHLPDDHEWTVRSSW